MDADGTKDGYDLALIRAVRALVTVPVIASGGAGRVEDFAPAVDAGADAVLAASVFHFGDLTIAAVKDALAAAGHPVRRTTSRSDPRPLADPRARPAPRTERRPERPDRHRRAARIRGRGSSARVRQMSRRLAAGGRACWS